MFMLHRERVLTELCGIPWSKRRGIKRFAVVCDLAIDDFRVSNKEHLRLNNWPPVAGLQLELGLRRCRDIFLTPVSAMS